MGGQDRVHWSKLYAVDDWIGNAPYNKYWMTSTQAQSSTPIDVNEPIISIVIQPTQATTWSADLTVKLLYHVQFFDLLTV
jgi:hypothetical protein